MRSNSSIYSLDNLRPYIVSLMKREGRITGNTCCEVCSKDTKNHYEIHHTKYAGATYYDFNCGVSFM